MHPVDRVTVLEETETRSKSARKKSTTKNTEFTIKTAFCYQVGVECNVPPQYVDLCGVMQAGPVS